MTTSINWRKVMGKYAGNSDVPDDTTAGKEMQYEVVNSNAYVKLPPFFTKIESTSDISNSWTKASRALQRKEKNGRILSNSDLERIWQTLQSCGKVDSSGSTDQIQIDFTQFLHVIQVLSEQRFRNYLKPSIFLQLAHNSVSRISAVTLFNFIVRKASLLQERVCLSAFDEEGLGYLTEKELEQYITDLIPSFPQLNGIEHDFLPFYICGAVRKFILFLESSRRGRVSIQDVLMSPILSEFFELQQDDLAPGLVMSNWFSVFSSSKIYSQYVQLDENRNGMLDCNEMTKFAKGRYTEAFILRLFQECQTFSGEMDYKNYLDFVLAMNELNHPRTLAYTFRILDIENCGYLDEFAVKYFLKAMKPRVALKFNEEDFLNEIFDMAHPREPNKISLDDLIRCGSGGTIISLLVDIHAFTNNQIKE